MNLLKICLISSIASASVLPYRLCAETKTFKVNKRYLNIPVSHSQDRHKMTFMTEKGETLTVAVRLAKEKEDYWVFRDLSNMKGKQLTVSYELDGLDGFQNMYMANEIEGQGTIYKEANRPQYHYTTRRGWNNDPNGMVYYEGEYHLFYQYNPYERDWGNMHWGHAVSTDLIHWKELPLALEPDEIGTMFSGSAVIDYDNTSGFGKKGKPALVALYTADTPAKEVQCLAYSLDKGRTFTKYEGNPVIDSSEKWNTRDLRDPKVFWYDPGNHWVMALYEKNGISIYNSSNLKDWTYESHVKGFHECPDLFELPVDGNLDNKKWVMLGASQTYMIGSFDGKIFTPEEGKYTYVTGSTYAAQTFGNTKDRIIQIGWGRIVHPDMPFKSMMCLPTELTLVTATEGIRLKSHPVKELERLQTPLSHWSHLAGKEATEKMKTWAEEDCLHIKAKVKTSNPWQRFQLTCNNLPLVDYDFNYNLLNGIPYSPQDFTSLTLDMDIYLDKTSYEVFMDGGLYSYIKERPTKGITKSGIAFTNDIEVIDLEIFRMESIWNQ